MEKLEVVIKSIDLNENRIEDISVFQRIDPYAIKDFIGLSYNNIKDISPLKNIILDFIRLEGNPIQNGQSIIQEMKDKGIQVFE